MMNTKRFLLIFIAVLISLSTFAQKIRNKQFALIDYNLSISKDIRNELSSLDSDIKKIKTYNESVNDKLQAIFVHMIYYTLEQKLKDNLNIEILPVNTFMREVKYDDYGFPKTSIREALRKGDSKYYFKVQVDIESITKNMKEQDPTGFSKVDYPVIFPQINIEIVVYNNEGILPVDKWIGTSLAQYPLTIDNYLLKGFDNTEMVVLPAENKQADNFYLILDRAIHSTIQSYLSK